MLQNLIEFPWKVFPQKGDETVSEREMTVVIEFEYQILPTKMLLRYECSERPNCQAVKRERSGDDANGETETNEREELLTKKRKLAE